MAIWVKYVGMNGWPPDFRVTHAGLPAIWARALGRRRQDAVLLAQIAGDLGFLNELRPQAREFLIWYAQRPDELTTDQRFRIATQLARYFDLPEQADSLLWGLGNTPGWSMSAVRSDIAVARLAKGYDATSARHIVNAILELFDIAAPRIGDYDEGKRDALERAGARGELRELGAAYVREAEARHQRPAESEWYAAASDYYLRAGDRERALELARRALPYMSAAAIALYRAGAIGEALDTHYLTGKERYNNATRAGEKKDPQWIVDDHQQSDIDSMVSEVAHSGDRELQQRAYDGLVQSCGPRLSACSTQTLRNIAQVAAGMGDEPRMKEALAAVVRQIDAKGKQASSWALNAAGSWAHCEGVRKRF
jgi:hypothetical protein